MAYQTALAAVCVEGILFIILAVTGLRLRLIRLVPKSIMLATSAGIGLFLAFIGLQSQEGLGIIAYDAGTLVSLGACPAGSQASLLGHHFPLPASPAGVTNLNRGTPRLMEGRAGWSQML